MANSEPVRRKPKFRERNVANPVPAIAEQAAPVAQALPEPRQRPASARAVAVAPERPDEVSSVFPWSAALPRVSVEQALYALIVTAGFILRIWDVGSRAMHGDESVHAWMAWNLYNGTGYHYDPVYHGPLQFIVTAALFFLFGVSETTARLMA